MQSLAKSNDRIRMGKIAVETGEGDKVKYLSYNELEEEKNKGTGNKKGP
jgi:hypothetical protein